MRISKHERKTKETQVSVELNLDGTGKYEISTGIGFLVRTLTRSRVNNGELVLCGVKGNVEKLFEIAKINEIFTIYTNVSEAKQHFNK